MSSERNIILKEWDKKEDLDIIKEVVTKGKYVNLCISFLSKRNQLNIAEMREIFSEKVAKYVESLLKNRQVFKAEHILKNVDEDPKYVFYEIIMKSNFNFLKDFILEHLKKTQNNFESEIDEIHSHWVLLRLIKTNNNILIEISEKNDYRIPNLNTLNLNGLYKKDFSWRQTVAIHYFFTLKDTNLSFFLNKELVWNYLLKYNKLDKLIYWLNYSAENMILTSDENNFETFLNSLFQKWTIDENMLEKIKEYPAFKNESVLNCLAKYGLFSNEDDGDILKLIRRIMTSESFNKNKLILMKKENTEKLINLLLERKLFGVIAELFNGNMLGNILTLDIEKTPEINLMLSIKNSTESNDIFTTSKHVSDFLLEKNTNFYSENPFVYIFEKLLSNEEVTSSTIDQTIISKLTHFSSFCESLKKIEEKTKVTPFDLILATHKIDLNQLKIDDDTTTTNKKVSPHFGNKTLSAKYSHSIKLTYLNYLRQYRSSYAVYLFFIEQLQNYSKITKEQILHASGLVANIALDNLNDNELITHCVAFIEMLGLDSLSLRAQLKCIKLVRKSIDGGDNCSINMTLEEFVDTLENELEKRTKHDDQFMKILPHLEAVIIFCVNNNLSYPKKLLKSLVKKDEWFKFIVLSQIMNYSMDDVIDICLNNFTNKNIGINIIRALTFPIQTPKTRRKTSFSQHKDTNMTSSSTSTTTSSSFTNQRKNITLIESDLFSIIINCTNDNSVERTIDELTFHEFFYNPEIIRNQSTYLNLLSYSINNKWPLLSIIAAMQTNDNPQFCWIVWLIISVRYEKNWNDFPLLCEDVIRYCVLNGFIRTLHESVLIFYPDSNFQLLTEFLLQTLQLDFSDEVNLLLQLYLVEISNNNVIFNFLRTNLDHKLFTFDLLMLHLNNNFNSLYYQRLLLNSLCESEICLTIDFCLLKNVTEIIELTDLKMNFNLFDQNHSEEEIRKEYEKICDNLVELKEFDKAMKLAELLNFFKENIVFENWIYKYEKFQTIDFDECELEIEKQNLNPELLINFYIHITQDLNYNDKKKYEILKKTLDTIKKYQLYPNETFDRDRIEYEMILSYLRININERINLDIYHSDFYERVLLNERFVIFNTFPELKEIAGIEDLTITNKKLTDENEMILLDELILKLLDKGDIIQALRLQGIFDQRPTDLHFLVFCMALAEQLVSLYDLSSQERQMLSSGFKIGSTKFNRRTLRTHRISQTSATSSSPPTTSKTTNYFELSDGSGGNTEFEEVPSRDKQDILEAIQVLASRLNHGVHIAQRIVLMYRASMYLFKEYVDLLKFKDIYGLLNSAINEDCLHKLVVLNDIMTSMKMEPIEIAEFIGHEISNSIIKSRFYLLQTSPKNQPSSIIENLLWGHNLDKEFHLFLDLCPDTTLLGLNLLKYCDCLKLYRRTENETDSADSNIFDIILMKLKDIMDDQVLSHKKQNIINVELIIKAHDCFVHECFMEGIVIVLQKSKLLANVLANAKSWNLIVRLLIGIGRYREMYYCFEMLIQNHQFESLLGKFEEHYTNGLKTAIISYLHEYHPENKEYFRLAALHFCMYKELAEMWETEAKSTIAQIISEFEIIILKTDDQKNNLKISYLKYDTKIITELGITMDACIHATENYLLDNQLNLAQKSANMAELIALQINLVKNSDYGNETIDKISICVLNITNPIVFRRFVNFELNIPQTLILSHSYSDVINWADAIYNHYILLDQEDYFNDFMERMELTPNIVENLVKIFQSELKITNKMEQSISNIVNMVQSVTLKYKLASLLGLKKIIANLINEQSLYYLKDTDYGRTNI